MCGIAGFLRRSGRLGEEARANVVRMTDSLVRRGPDSSGCWLDPAAGIVLGHRRLAIVELSEAGAQPMESATGRYVIAFNGEVYNHLALRSVLELAGLAPAWRGHSDTETLLAGFEAWGIQATVDRCIGMFAFSVWDRRARALTLGRDRLGEKPLYFGWQGRGEESTFLFGSDLAALRAHPAFSADIDRGALCLLLRHGCVPAPRSIFHGIRKVMPGTLLTVTAQDDEERVTTYWSAADAAVAGSGSPDRRPEGELLDDLARLLESAVRQQMVADVPLGAFLSGGVDSSTVVAIMQSLSSRPVKTFTIGFGEGAYDEAVHAKAVAAHLGTDHTELYVTPRQALDVIPLLPSIYAEPFADASQIPTFLVARLARRQVTVSLSGDAGDEVFGGYNRYLLTKRLWGRLSRLPVAFRRSIARTLTTVTPSRWDSLAGAVQPLLPAPLRQANMGDKVHKGAAILAAGNLDALYLGLTSHWSDPASVVVDAKEPRTALTGDGPRFEGLDEIQRMMLLDLLLYLPDDVLAKVDRAAMGVSLETRVPFLDHRVVEFAWRLPQSLKLRDGLGKWALRQVLYRHVPRELIERPKMGFSVPIDSWLRGPLREWADDLLAEDSIRRDGYLNPGPIREKWAEHLSGRRNWHRQLWDVLMFQAWRSARR